MDSEQKSTEGTNIVASYHAAMDIMMLEDDEQRQFFEKLVAVNFDGEETEYGVSVDCCKRQLFFEVYLMKDFDDDDEPLHYLEEVNEISIDEYLDLCLNKKAI
jgi:hypothetical protein